MLKVTRFRLLCAVCTWAVALVFTGCGKNNVENKPASKATKKVAKASPVKAEKKSTKAKPSKAVPLSGDGLGVFGQPSSVGEALNPLAGQNNSVPPGLANAPIVAGKPVASPTVMQRPESRQLFELLQKFYRVTSTIKCQGYSSTTVKQDGKTVGTQKPQKISSVIKKPASFVLGSPEGSLTCDGKTVYSYSKQAKQYAKNKFSPEFARSMIQGKPGVGMMGLMFGVDYMPSISSYKLLKDEKLGQKDMFVLSLKFKKGTIAPPDTNITQKLWIGKQDLGIYKNIVIAITRPKRPKGYTGKMPKLIRTTIIGTADTIEINAKIPDSFFKFKVPAGAKLAEKPKQIDAVGKPAPDFSFTAADGSKKKISDLKGKPVLMIFWAMPMPDGQLPALESAYQKHKADIEVVAINFNQDTAKVQDALQKKGMSVPVLPGNESIAKIAMQQYGLRGLPTLFLIDKEGIVRTGTYGIPPEKGLDEMLEKLTVQ